MAANRHPIFIKTPVTGKSTGIVNMVTLYAAGPDGGRIDKVHIKKVSGSGDVTFYITADGGTTNYIFDRITVSQDIVLKPTEYFAILGPNETIKVTTTADVDVVSFGGDY